MPVEKDFSSITSLAACICGCKSSFICIFDSELRHQTGIICSEELTGLLCGQKLPADDVTDIFAKLPVQFRSLENTPVCLAAAPLFTASGKTIGALCITDQNAITLDNRQKKALLLLASQLVSKLINTKSKKQLDVALAKAEKFHNLFNESSEIHCITDPEGKIEYVNDFGSFITGLYRCGNYRKDYLGFFSSR